MSPFWSQWLDLWSNITTTNYNLPWIHSHCLCSIRRIYLYCRCPIHCIFYCKQSTFHINLTYWTHWHIYPSLSLSPFFSLSHLSPSFTCTLAFPIPSSSFSHFLILFSPLHSHTLLSHSVVFPLFLFPSLSFTLFLSLSHFLSPSPRPSTSLPPYFSLIPTLSLPPSLASPTISPFYRNQMLHKAMEQTIIIVIQVVIAEAVASSLAENIKVDSIFNPKLFTTVIIMIQKHSHLYSEKELSVQVLPNNGCYQSQCLEHHLL